MYRARRGGTKKPPIHCIFIREHALVITETHYPCNPGNTCSIARGSIVQYGVEKEYPDLSNYSK